MGRRQVRLTMEERRAFCNLCGKRTAEVADVVDDACLRDVRFNFSRNCEYWCAACVNFRGGLISRLREKHDGAMFNAAFKFPVNRYCSACGSRLGGRNKFFCTACSKKIYPDVKLYRPEQLDEMMLSYRRKRHVRLNTLDLSGGMAKLKSMSLEEKRAERRRKDQYCNFCGRVTDFPNRDFVRGMTKYWCGQCIADPEIRSLLRQTSMPKHNYCVKCRKILLYAGHTQYCELHGGVQSFPPDLERLDPRRYNNLKANLTEWRRELLFSS